MSHGGTAEESVNNKEIGLQYLNGLPPWAGGGFTLEAITRVLRYLGNPQDSYPTVHIAGTNGKGSVSVAVASILGAAGYTVGLNTSPHLEKLNERIVIDGVSCSDALLGEVAYEIKRACERSVTTLSFHEALTAVAALAMREVGVDWGVFEVGLGGRLDASNVISRPAAVAIVTIDYDHQHILGETLGEIAKEKAGIIKPGSVVVTGILPKEAQAVVASTSSKNMLHVFGRDFDARIVKRGEVGASIVYWGKNPINGKDVNFEFESPLMGDHQAHNLAVAASLGLAVGVGEQEIACGLGNVFWPGRLEQATIQDIEITIDCAHNRAGVQSFLSYLEQRGDTMIDLTFGVLDTKNWKEMLGLLLPRVKTLRLLSPDSSRALPLVDIEEEVRLSGIDIRIVSYHKDYEGCLKAILSESENGRAYITGSMYMVGAMRSMLGLESKPLWKKFAEKSRSPLLV